MILFDQHWSLHIVSRFPHVIAFGVSHPLYEILQLFVLPVTSVAADGLDLVLLIIINEVRWWSGIVFAVFIYLDVWG